MIYDKVKIAKRIKQYRIKSGLTQAALGKEIGVDSNTISRLENGRHLPSLGTAESLAIVFNVTVSDILGR
jgi:DNA-binding XRE family transcriptional regulator